MYTIETIPERYAAATLEGPERLVVREIPRWPIADYGEPDLVMIRVEACGVCGSDFRYFVGENPWAQHTLGRFMPNPPNIVLGHEYAGTVVAVLREQDRHLLGQRVAPVCSRVCGSCPECRAGRSRLCPNTVHLGHGQGWGERDFYPGAYGRYAPAWAHGCYEIPDDLSFSEAAMMDILAVCVHVAEMGQVQPGRPVLCLGAGPAGNGVAQAALALGASEAFLLDRSDEALEVLARQAFGVGVSNLGIADPEIAAQLLARAPLGFGTVFDTIGTSSSVQLGLSVLGKAGTLVNMAVHDEPIPFNFMALGSERRIVTSCNFEIGDYARALAWLAAGRLRVQEWLTPVALRELPTRFMQTVTGQKTAFKMVVTDFR